MSSRSSWVPNEAPQTHLSERSWLQGLIIGAIAYGIVVSLYFLSVYLFVHAKNRAKFKKRAPLLIYITVMYLLASFSICTFAGVAQMAFVDNRNFPGGPNGYLDAQFSIPVDIAGIAAIVLSGWLADALQVWRFKILYEWCWVPLWIVMLFPCLMLAGCLVLGVLLVIQLWTSKIFTVDHIYYALPYFGLSLALNVILPISMVLRLLTLRYRIVSILGSTYGKHYISTTAIIIESAALYSTISIPLITLLGMRSAVSHAFLQLHQFQTLSTFLIIFRVAQGKDWTEDSETHIMATQRTDLSELGFALPSTPLTLVGFEEVAKTSRVEPEECPHASINTPV